MKIKSLKIAVIGAGNFGNSLLKLFARYGSGHEIIQLDKARGSEDITNLALIKTCDVVIPAVPIAKFRQVIAQIAPVIKEGTTVVDVCTIKEYSTRSMLDLLPENSRLLVTHPLFGPESLAANEWNLTGLKIMLWPCRIEEPIFEQLVTILKSTGLSVIVMSPEEHDRVLARSQFLSLLIGALLVKMDIQSTEMNTRSFDELLDVQMTTAHDYEILKDVFTFNEHCGRTLSELREVLSAITSDLQARREALMKIK